MNPVLLGPVHSEAVSSTNRTVHSPAGKSGAPLAGASRADDATRVERGQAREMLFGDAGDLAGPSPEYAATLYSLSFGARVATPRRY